MEIFEENKQSKLYSSLFLVSLLLAFASFITGVIIKEGRILLLTLLFMISAIFCKFVSDKLSGGSTYMIRLKHYFTSKIMVCENLEEADEILAEFKKLAIINQNRYRHVTSNSHELFKEIHKEIMFLIRYLESRQVVKKK